jgi:hypothetical protein
VRATGPIDDLCTVIGDLGEIVTTASTHVLKTLLDSEVNAAAEEPCVTDVCATLDITVRHQYAVRLDFCLAKEDARRIAARVRSVAASAVSNDDVTAALTEILTEVRGRLQSAITAKQVEFACSMPRIRHQDSMEMEVPRDGHGLQLPFTTADARITLLASVMKENGQAVAGAA